MCEFSTQLLRETILLFHEIYQVTKISFSVGLFSRGTVICSVKRFHGAKHEKRNS